MSLGRQIYFNSTSSQKHLFLLRCDMVCEGCRNLLSNTLFFPKKQIHQKPPVEFQESLTASANKFSDFLRSLIHQPGFFCYSYQMLNRCRPAKFSLTQTR